MPRIYICFVWHMHQPFYKDLISGEYHLPWTRMHALKDYYGMVRLLEEFPQVHQTFNLVPSMMTQIQEYVDGSAIDPFLRVALKPAEDLASEEREFLLRYFFQTHPGVIRRYPRYGELYDGWNATAGDPGARGQFFQPQAIRDLQVLSQVAWFDEEFHDRDAEVRQLVAKGREFSLEDQVLMGRKQREIMGCVLPVYRDAARRGQIEISTTPFYHPILPLLCDSQIAAVAHPGVPLPPPFRYPEDARHQLATARDYMVQTFGVAPAGLWPSEGSVSDAVFTIAAEMGFRWAATDNGVLTRTLNHMAGVEETYRPYSWRQSGHDLRVLFRDHFLSDLIGFVYSRMGAEEAAVHFLDRIRENCHHFLARGEDALVPVILDGENAWEHYDRSGRPFLRELYRRIQDDSSMEAVTVSEAISRVEPRVIGHIFPGSWINANFDVWIGAEEDNRAWEMLLRAREVYEEAIRGPRSGEITEGNRKLAFEELLIAEGSDWCWWYGPEHHSDNRPEFDRLYRSHLANVYHALGIRPPDELSRPILRLRAEATHVPPSARLRVTVDGEVSSFFEWMGAGVYQVDGRSSAMHGQRSPLREMHYGSDGEKLFLRFDIESQSEPLRLHLRFERREWDVTVPDPLPQKPLDAAHQRILEVGVPLQVLGAQADEPIRLQVSLWRGALPVDALPAEGWIELAVADELAWRL